LNDKTRKEPNKLIVESIEKQLFVNKTNNVDNYLFVMLSLDEV